MRDDGQHTIVARRRTFHPMSERTMGAAAPAVRPTAWAGEARA
ncbi:hypothetical protein [Nocardia sp. BMG51109]|nr:hypothetical protein [Nocardia sp. BMG51109]